MGSNGWRNFANPGLFVVIGTTANKFIFTIYAVWFRTIVGNHRKGEIEDLFLILPNGVVNRFFLHAGR